MALVTSRHIEAMTVAAPAQLVTASSASGRVAALTSHRHCHAAARTACRRGLCIPGFLLEQWRAQMDPDQRAAESAWRAITAFISETVASLPAGPLGEPLKVWRNAWDVRFRASGETGRQWPGKGDASKEAMKRTLAKVLDEEAK
jgi:hypothetical protein